MDKLVMILKEIEEFRKSSAYTTTIRILPEPPPVTQVEESRMLAGPPNLDTLDIDKSYRASLTIGEEYFTLRAKSYKKMLKLLIPILIEYFATEG